MSLSFVLPLLPPAMRGEILSLLSAPTFRSVTLGEVRLRRGRVASLSLFRAHRLVNLPLSFIATADDIKSTFALASGDSLYACEETVKEGYLTLSHGVRVGVAGSVVARRDGSLSLTSLDSLVFRLPARSACADALFSFYRASCGGILLFSPPGGGKTTLLRAFGARVAREERVAVVDTRGELFFEGRELLVDRLLGYPKAKGAELAVRTLSPELLILDELGAEEAAALSALAAFGVRVVASAHGDTSEELLHSPALSPLFRSGVFRHLWEVKRGCALPVGEVRA